MMLGEEHYLEIQIQENKFFFTTGAINASMKPEQFGISEEGRKDHYVYLGKHLRSALEGVVLDDKEEKPKKLIVHAGSIKFSIIRREKKMYQVLRATFVPEKLPKEQEEDYNKKVQEADMRDEIVSVRELDRYDSGLSPNVNLLTEKTKQQF